VDYIKRIGTGPDAKKQLAEMASVAGADGGNVAMISQMDPVTLGIACDQAAKFYEESLAIWDAPNAQDQLEALGTRASNGGYGTIGRVVCPSMGKVRSSATKGSESLARCREIINNPGAKAEEQPAK